jgi:hypothetical protein
MKYQGMFISILRYEMILIDSKLPLVSCLVINLLHTSRLFSVTR